MSLNPLLSDGHSRRGSVRRRSDRSTWPECEYCQARERRLFQLPLVRPMGELTGLAVCVFCYIRLAGEKPRAVAPLRAGSTGG